MREQARAGAAAGRPELASALTAAKSIPGKHDLLPGDPPRIWDEALDIAGVAGGEYKLAMRVPNKLPNGHPVRFANQTQDADVPGWLTLGTTVVGSQP